MIYLTNFQLHRFNKYVHKLSLLICVFGVVTNILNFIVLTRRSLRTEINVILAALAVTDGLVMLIYTPYALDNAFNFYTRDERFTYGYSLYIFLHATLTLTIHTISIFLTILLAFYRYICVCRNSSTKTFFKRTTPMILISCIFAIIISIPMYLSLTINENINQEGLKKYFVASTELMKHHETIYFWIYSVVIKLLPCILLTFFTIKLIQVLLKAKKSSALTNNGVSTNLFKRRRNQSDRTTALLVSVLILFLLTQFPQAILGFFSAILHRHFYERCYQRMGE
jgi:hypothetical protein